MEKVFKHIDHKRLWTWLHFNPEKHKNDWPEWEYNGGDVPEVFGDCFACEYSIDCTDCPLVWEDGNEHFNCALFFKWDESEDTEIRREIALRIANLPIREGTICK